MTRKIVAKTKRDRKRFRIRNRINKSHVAGREERARISVFRSSKHTYAQVILDSTHKTLASASTLDKEVLDKAKGAVKGDAKSSAKSVAAARAVGLLLAERVKKQNIKKVVFDRNGFLYAGRIQAVADGAREGGLDF